MARITIEDCLEKINNRFALVILSAQRTKQLMRNSKPLVPSENKPVVTALREIAAGKVRCKTDLEEIKEITPSACT